MINLDAGASISISACTPEKTNIITGETMLNLEAQLNSERFVRIHRSAIPNTELIKELQTWFRGDYVIVLRDNQN